MPLHIGGMFVLIITMALPNRYRNDNTLAGYYELKLDALVAFQAVRLARCLADEPDGHHPRCNPRRPSAGHAMGPYCAAPPAVRGAISGAALPLTRGYRR